MRRSLAAAEFGGNYQKWHHKFAAAAEFVGTYQKWHHLLAAAIANLADSIEAHTWDIVISIFEFNDASQNC